MNSYYKLLHQETVESLFYVYQITKMYQKRGKKWWWLLLY